MGPVIDMTYCPECGQPAEVQDRAVFESTDGAVEHAKIICLRRHWFFLPVSMLVARQGATASAPSAPQRMARSMRLSDHISW